MRTHNTLLRWGLLSLLAAAGSPAWGQVEINQTTALAGNVTPGDAAGFPVTLSVGGSYKLTSNLSVPNANTTAILITANSVTLDLNGFSIRGKTVCTGSPVSSCSPTGTGIGVDATGRKGIVIRNGQVFGMGKNGIVVGPYSRVEQVGAQSNGLIGIQTGDGCLVSGSTASRNRSAGVYAGLNNVVTGNIARENGKFGVFADAGSIVSGNAASVNKFNGIRTTHDSVVSGNTANLNGAGISSDAGNTVTGNTASGNGGADIIDSHGTVLGNTVRSNGSPGLLLDAFSGYGHNVANDNNGGNTNPQVSQGIELDGNVCGGDTTCS